MYIQNYDDLDEECQKLAEICGWIAEHVIYDRALPGPLREKLVELSAKTGRPIEICDVRGEIWINIRERRPIPKEAIEAFILGAKLSWQERVKSIAKEYHKMATPTVNMTDRIKSQWRW